MGEVLEIITSVFKEVSHDCNENVGSEYSSSCINRNMADRLRYTSLGAPFSCCRSDVCGGNRHLPGVNYMGEARIQQGTVIVRSPGQKKIAGPDRSLRRRGRALSCPACGNNQYRGGADT